MGVGDHTCIPNMPLSVLQCHNVFVWLCLGGAGDAHAAAVSVT